LTGKPLVVAAAVVVDRRREREKPVTEFAGEAETEGVEYLTFADQANFRMQACEEVELGKPAVAAVVDVAAVGEERIDQAVGLERTQPVDVQGIPGQ